MNFAFFFGSLLPSFFPFRLLEFVFAQDSSRFISLNWIWLAPCLMQFSVYLTIGFVSRTLVSCFISLVCVCMLMKIQSLKLWNALHLKCRWFIAVQRFKLFHETQCNVRNAGCTANKYIQIIQSEEKFCWIWFLDLKRTKTVSWIFLLKKERMYWLFHENVSSV